MSKKRSIKWKLIVMFTSISTLPVIVLGGLATYFTAKSLESEINVKNLLLSKIFINQTEKYLDEPLKDLQAVRDIIESHGLGEHTFVLFKELLGRHEYFIKFILTSKDGYITHIFPQDDNLLGNDMSGRRFFQKVTETNASYWSSIFISSPDNIPVSALSIPLPNAILTAHLNLRRLSEITGELSETEDIQVSVTDQTGTFISHSNELKVLQREVDLNFSDFRENRTGEISQLEMSHDGQNYICHIGFIRQTGWSVMISQPFEKTYLPVKNLLFVILSLTLIFFCLSFYFAYRYGSVIKNSVDKFLESTSQIATGRYDKSISGLEYSEFTELAESIYGMAQDIQEREHKILESRRMFRAVFHSDAIGTSIINFDLSLRRVNQRWSEITGYNILDLKEDTILSLIPPEDRDQTEALLQDMLQGKTSTARLEKRLIRQDGSEIWVDHTMALIGKNHGKPYLVGMLMDNTDKKRASEEKKLLEKKLQQAHKMEAVGSLAGGIAHDFNNILSAMLGYADISLVTVSADSPIVKYLKEIKKAGIRAKDLVQQILSFSRQSETEMTIVDPQQIVSDALKMLRPSIPSTIEIETEIEKDAGYILANSAQVHQIVVNLCTNAFQAMEKTGGTLRIHLNRLALTKTELAHVPHVTPGDFIHLTIEDSGPGIPKDIRNKIFDPYFTTKDFGKGTGMGLAIVHGNVSHMGGFITLDEDHNPGTSFSVYLPIVNRTKAKLQLGEMPIPRGEESILLVDDEEMLTDMGQSMLENLGYKVTIANSGKEALQIFTESPDSFDLVVSDQTMPKISGLDLASQLLTIRPTLPIILCTGYSSVVSKEEAQEIGIMDFMYKPYSARDISSSIRKVMDKRNVDHQVRENL